MISYEKLWGGTNFPGLAESFQNFLIESRRCCGKLSSSRERVEDKHNGLFASTFFDKFEG